MMRPSCTTTTASRIGLTRSGDTIVTCSIRRSAADKAPGKTTASKSQPIRDANDNFVGMCPVLKRFRGHQTRPDWGIAPENNVERSNWHDERLDLRLNGEFPVCAVATMLFLGW